MHERSIGSALFVLLVAAGGAAGCSNSASDGTLSQGWTISGARNPNACAAAKAAQMRLIVINPSSIVTATQFASCADFQMILSLPPNTYTGAATFLDASGAAVSRTLVVPAFDIAAGQTTVQSVDFAPKDFP